MDKGCINTGAYILAGFLIVMYVSDTFFSKDDKKEPEQTVTPKLPSIPHLPSWEYSRHMDEMTSKMEYHASIESTDVLYFDFPYDGGSKVTINIVFDGSPLVYLTVDKGQFPVSIGGDETLKVKFDNEVFTYSFSNSGDHSLDNIFINNVSSFINRLKKSTSLVIETSFYSEGVRTIHFIVGGLVWPH